MGSDRIVEAVLSDFLERTVTEKEILHFSFNRISKKRLRMMCGLRLRFCI